MYYGKSGGILQARLGYGAVGMENLHVKGMLAHDKLGRAISDVGVGMFRWQMEYMARRYGTRPLSPNAGIRVANGVASGGERAVFV